MSYKYWFHLPILSLNLADVFQSCFSHLKLDIKYTIFAARCITFWRHVNIFTVSSLMKIHSRIIWQETAGMSLDSNEVIAHLNLNRSVIEDF